MTHVLARFAAAFADAVWPARCALCGDAGRGPEEQGGEDLGDGLGCADHRFETGLPGPRCGRCAASISAALPDGERCPDCRARSPGFARVAALGAYRSAANADWLLALKYGGRADLAEPLGALLAARLSLEIERERVLAPARSGATEGAPANTPVPGSAQAHGIAPAHATARTHGTAQSLRAATVHEHASRRVLVPVPLHFVRRIERGYDQAWLLARACGEEAGLPALRVLRRVRATPVQGALGTSSRAANVRGAFAPSIESRWNSRRIAGADVWLVDDVLTSGSTAAECARILRRLGARSVSVLCVARP